MTARMRLAVAMAGCALAASPAAAEATTYTVRATGDALHGSCGATCTLRDAVRAANAHAGADTIVLAARTYALTRAGTGEDAAATGDLDVTGPTTVVGAGSARTTLDARTLDRAFDLAAPTARLTLRGMRVVHARSDLGGCVSASQGTGLTLVDVVLDHCRSAGDAGALYAAGAIPVTLDRVRVVGGVAGGAGGGLLIGTAGAVVLRRSAIGSSRASAYGGLLRVGTGSTTLDRVEIRGNRTTVGPAGGAYISTGAGTVTLRLVRILRNTSASSFGGGFVQAHVVTVRDSEIADNLGGPVGGLQIAGDAAGATLTVERSTVAQNRSTTPGPGSGLALLNGIATTLRDVSVVGNAEAGVGPGGGIYADAPLVLRSTTVAGNTAAMGGGIYATTTVDAANSIVDGGCYLVGAVTSRGGNIDRGTSCGFTAATDRQATDPLLDVFGPHGGPVRTIGLRKGSPAIDHAVPGYCPATDARGVHRPRDGDGDGHKVCDIGAVER